MNQTKDTELEKCAIPTCSNKGSIGYRLKKKSNSIFEGLCVTCGTNEFRGKVEHARNYEFKCLGCDADASSFDKARNKANPTHKTDCPLKGKRGTKRVNTDVPTGDELPSKRSKTKKKKGARQSRTTSDASDNVASTSTPVVLTQGSSNSNDEISFVGLAMTPTMVFGESVPPKQVVSPQAIMHGQLQSPALQQLLSHMVNNVMAPDNYNGPSGESSASSFASGSSSTDSDEKLKLSYDMDDIDSFELDSDNNLTLDFSAPRSSEQQQQQQLQFQQQQQMAWYAQQQQVMLMQQLLMAQFPFLFSASLGSEPAINSHVKRFMHPQHPTQDSVFHNSEPTRDATSPAHSTTLDVSECERPTPSAVEELPINIEAESLSTSPEITVSPVACIGETNECAEDSSSVSNSEGTLSNRIDSHSFSGNRGVAVSLMLSDPTQLTGQNCNISLKEDDWEGEESWDLFDNLLDV